MVVYIAFIASLNLCVGYALGVYIGVMPGIVPRHRREVDDEVPVDPPVVQVRKPAPPATPAPPAMRTAPVPLPPTPSEAATPSRAPTADILAGLASFREQLAHVSSDLRRAGEDRQAIDKCAHELKHANDDYLEKASDVLDTIDADKSGTNAALKETLIEQTGAVEQASAEIDTILAEDDAAKVRDKLLASSEQLSDSAAEVEQAIPTEIDGDAPSRDRPTCLVPIDELLRAIDEHLAANNAAPLQVASIVFNDDRLDDPLRLLDALSRVVAQSLDDDQLAAIDDRGRLMVLLAGDDENGANMRCERARQQVAATTFRSSDKALRATVSCAVADTTRIKKRQDLLAHLDESIDEALRYGESRTFHHDGRFPAPIVPPKLNVAAMEVEW